MTFNPDEFIKLPAPTWQYNDGGREDAGFKGQAGDCVTRAIAIATGMDYREVYNELAQREAVKSGKRSARNGISKDVLKAYLADLGWTWTPTMQIGSGTKVHLKKDELPTGTVICSVSKHVVTVIDGVIHDTYDPSRNGSRAVYGYWTR